MTQRHQQLLGPLSVEGQQVLIANKGEGLVGGQNSDIKFRTNLMNEPSNPSQLMRPSALEKINNRREIQVHPNRKESSPGHKRTNDLLLRQSGSFENNLESQNDPTLSKEGLKTLTRPAISTAGADSKPLPMNKRTASLLTQIIVTEAEAAKEETNNPKSRQMLKQVGQMGSEEDDHEAKKREDLGSDAHIAKAYAALMESKKESQLGDSSILKNQQIAEQQRRRDRILTMNSGQVSLAEGSLGPASSMTKSPKDSRTEQSHPHSPPTTDPHLSSKFPPSKGNEKKSMIADTKKVDKMIGKIHGLQTRQQSLKVKPSANVSHNQKRVSKIQERFHQAKDLISRKQQFLSTKPMKQGVPPQQSQPASVAQNIIVDMVGKTDYKIESSHFSPHSPNTQVSHRSPTQNNNYTRNLMESSVITQISKVSNFRLQPKSQNPTGLGDFVHSGFHSRAKGSPALPTSKVQSIEIRAYQQREMIQEENETKRAEPHNKKSTAQLQLSPFQKSAVNLNNCKNQEGEDDHDDHDELDSKHPAAQSKDHFKTQSKHQEGNEEGGTKLNNSYASRKESGQSNYVIHKNASAQNNSIHTQIISPQAGKSPPQVNCDTEHFPEVGSDRPQSRDKINLSINVYNRQKAEVATAQPQARPHHHGKPCGLSHCQGPLRRGCQCLHHNFGLLSSVNCKGGDNIPDPRQEGMPPKTAEFFPKRRRMQGAAGKAPTDGTANQTAVLGGQDNLSYPVSDFSGLPPGQDPKRGTIFSLTNTTGFHPIDEHGRGGYFSPQNPKLSQNIVPQGGGKGITSADGSRSPRVHLNSRGQGTLVGTSRKGPRPSQLPNSLRGHRKEVSGATRAQFAAQFEIYSSRDSATLNALSPVSNSVIVDSLYNSMSQSRRHQHLEKKILRSLEGFTSTRSNRFLNNLIYDKGHELLFENTDKSDESVSIMKNFDLREIRQSLYGHDGGAELSQNRVPFFINQQSKEGKVQMTKTQKLRKQRFDPLIATTQRSLLPRDTNYVLQRIQANEGEFFKSKDRVKAKVHLYNELLNSVGAVTFSERNGDGARASSLEQNHVSKYTTIKSDIRGWPAQSLDIKNQQEMTMGRGVQTSNRNGNSPALKKQHEEQSAHCNSDRVLLNLSMPASKPSSRDHLMMPKEIESGEVGNIKIQQQEVTESSRLKNKKNSTCSHHSHDEEKRRMAKLQRSLQSNAHNQKKPKETRSNKGIRYHPSQHQYSNLKHMQNAHTTQGLSPIDNMSISKNSKVTIGESNLRELGIRNFKHGSTHNIFGTETNTSKKQLEENESSCALMMVSQPAQTSFPAPSAPNGELADKPFKSKPSPKKKPAPPPPGTKPQQYVPLQQKKLPDLRGFSCLGLNPQGIAEVVGSSAGTPSSPGKQGSKPSSKKQEIVRIDLNQFILEDKQRQMRQQNLSPTTELNLDRTENVKQFELSDKLSPQGSKGGGVPQLSSMSPPKQQQANLETQYLNSKSGGGGPTGTSSETKPIWLINKKPKSLIVNYKTKFGQNITKLSQGDPQYKQAFKGIANQSQTYSTARKQASIEDSTDTDQNQVVCIFSEQIELADRNASNQVRATSTLPENNPSICNTNPINQPPPPPESGFKSVDDFAQERGSLTIETEQQNASQQQQAAAEYQQKPTTLLLGNQIINSTIFDMQQTLLRDSKTTGVDQPMAHSIPPVKLDLEPQVIASQKQGLTDLKVGVNPRFLLQQSVNSAASNEGGKTEPTVRSQKKTDIDYSTFQNLNLYQPRSGQQYTSEEMKIIEQQIREQQQRFIQNFQQLQKNLQHQQQILMMCPGPNFDPAVPMSLPSPNPLLNNMMYSHLQQQAAASIYNVAASGMNPSIFSIEQQIENSMSNKGGSNDDPTEDVSFDTLAKRIFIQTAQVDKGEPDKRYNTTQLASQAPEGAKQSTNNITLPRSSPAFKNSQISKQNSDYSHSIMVGTKLLDYNPVQLGPNIVPISEKTSLADKSQMPNISGEARSSIHPMPHSQDPNLPPEAQFHHTIKVSKSNSKIVYQKKKEPSPSKFKERAENSGPQTARPSQRFKLREGSSDRDTPGNRLLTDKQHMMILSGPLTQRLNIQKRSHEKIQKKRGSTRQSNGGTNKQINIQQWTNVREVMDPTVAITEKFERSPSKTTDINMTKPPVGVRMDSHQSEDKQSPAKMPSTGHGRNHSNSMSLSKKPNISASFNIGNFEGSNDQTVPISQSDSKTPEKQVKSDKTTQLIHELVPVGPQKSAVTTPPHHAMVVINKNTKADRELMQQLTIKYKGAFQLDKKKDLETKAEKSNIVLNEMRSLGKGGFVVGALKLRDRTEKTGSPTEAGKELSKSHFSAQFKQDHLETFKSKKTDENTEFVDHQQSNNEDYNLMIVTSTAGQGENVVVEKLAPTQLRNLSQNSQINHISDQKQTHNISSRSLLHEKGGDSKQVNRSYKKSSKGPGSFDKRTRSELPRMQESIRRIKGGEDRHETGSPDLPKVPEIERGEGRAEVVPLRKSIDGHLGQMKRSTHDNLDSQGESSIVRSSRILHLKHSVESDPKSSQYMADQSKHLSKHRQGYNQQLALQQVPLTRTRIHQKRAVKRDHRDTSKEIASPHHFTNRAALMGSEALALPKEQHQSMKLALKDLSKAQPKPSYKKDFGCKFRFPPKSNHGKRGKESPLRSKNLNIRQLCSQSRKRQVMQVTVNGDVVKKDSQPGGDNTSFGGVTSPISGKSEFKSATKFGALSLSPHSRSKDIFGGDSAHPVLKEDQHATITPAQRELFSNFELHTFNSTSVEEKQAATSKVRAEAAKKVSLKPAIVESPFLLDEESRARSPGQTGIGDPWEAISGVPFGSSIVARNQANFSSTSNRTGIPSLPSKNDDINDKLKNLSRHQQQIQQLHYYQTLALISGQLSTENSKVLGDLPKKSGANDQNSQKAKSGNPFHGVRKGLVSSSHVPRKVNRLGGEKGKAFKNLDGVQMMVSSPRQAIVGTNQTAPVVNLEMAVNQQRIQVSPGIENQGMSLYSKYLQKSVDLEKGSPNHQSQNQSKTISPQKMMNPLSSNQMRNHQRKYPLASSIVSDPNKTGSELFQDSKISELFGGRSNGSQGVGERELFTLPTSVIEELRKDSRDNSLQQTKPNFGLIGSKCMTSGPHDGTKKLAHDIPSPLPQRQVQKIQVRGNVSNALLRQDFSNQVTPVERSTNYSPPIGHFGPRRPNNQTDPSNLDLEFEADELHKPPTEFNETGPHEPKHQHTQPYRSPDPGTSPHLVEHQVSA